MIKICLFLIPGNNRVSDHACSSATPRFYPHFPTTLVCPLLIYSKFVPSAFRAISHYSPTRFATLHSTCALCSGSFLKYWGRSWLDLDKLSIKFDMNRLCGVASMNVCNESFIMNLYMPSLLVARCDLPLVQFRFSQAVLFFLMRYLVMRYLVFALDLYK